MGQVTAVGARALLESLRAPDSGDGLSSLELDFNPLGDAGAQPLPAYLKEKAARGGGGLEELSLRFCDIGPAGCRCSYTAVLTCDAMVFICLFHCEIRTRYFYLRKKEPLLWGRVRCHWIWV